MKKRSTGKSIKKMIKRRISRRKPKVIIRPQAFISLISSAVEVYKKESVGLMLGTKRGDYHIQNSIIYQTAKRHYNVVSLDERTFARVNSTLKTISHQKIVGDFHSHPEGPGYLSRDDVKDLRQNPDGYLSILVVLKRVTRKRKWKENMDKSISGTVDDVYSVKILAYTICKKTGNLIKLKIKCPYINKMNGKRMKRKPRKKRKK